MKIGDKCRTLIDLFEHSVDRAELAEKNCLEIIRAQRQEALTFGQLKTRAHEFAVHLMQSGGIRTGDKIAILGRNRVDWDVAFWGGILAGAVPVLIDPERRIEGVKKHLLHTDSVMLVMADDYQDDESRELLGKFAYQQGLEVMEMTVYEKPNPSAIYSAMLATKVRSEVKADDTAVILCTSGTTGDPREVEITHDNFIANIQGALDVVEITAADKLGHIMPPHHCFGLTVTKLLTLWVGATNIYTNKYRQISRLIKEKEITIFAGIPALYTVFARKIEDRLTRLKEKSRLVRLADSYLSGLVGMILAKRLGMDKLRFFVSGAAAVPKWVLGVFWKRGLQLREGYGTTENSPIYGFNDDYKKLGSVGLPIPTMRVKIVNEQDVTLASGERGEIVLGGPCIAKGYYKNPKATEAVIKTDTESVRWLYTGDLGHLDEDGYLFITGRKKNLIVLPGGKNVNPEVVEQALSKAAYVEEMIVVPGYQDGTAGHGEEAVKAIVRPAWRQIRVDTRLRQRDLVSRPDELKELVWQSINKCQRESLELAGFEKVQSKHHLEIKIDEFKKTTTGKIKRDSYMQVK